MTCEQCQTQLNALADGELFWVQAWRVRRHRAQCPGCAQAFTQIMQIGTEARQWRASVPPDTLAVRIASALPTQTDRTKENAMILERPLPRPKRPAPRFVFAAVLCLAALAVLAFWPGSPGRPTVAYADVVRAMQSIQSLHCYGRTETTASDKHGGHTNTQTMEYWAVLGPRVEDAEGAVRVSTPGVWAGRNHAGWEISPEHGAALRIDLMRLLDPPSGGTDDIMGVKVGGPEYTPWQQDTVQQGGRSLLRFQHHEKHEIMGNAHIQTVLVDSQTRLVVDIVDRWWVHLDKPAQHGAPPVHTFRTYADHLDRFDYNHAPPAEVFARDKPAGR